MNKQTNLYKSIQAGVSRNGAMNAKIRMKMNGNINWMIRFIHCQPTHVCHTFYCIFILFWTGKRNESKWKSVLLFGLVWFLSFFLYRFLFLHMDFFELLILSDSICKRVYTYMGDLLCIDPSIATHFEYCLRLTIELNLEWFHRIQNDFFSFGPPMNQSIFWFKVPFWNHRAHRAVTTNTASIEWWKGRQKDTHFGTQTFT